MNKRVRSLVFLTVVWVFSALSPPLRADGWSTRIYDDLLAIFSELISRQVGTELAKQLQERAPELCFHFRGVVDRMRSAQWSGMVPVLRAALADGLRDFLYFALTDGEEAGADSTSRASPPGAAPPQPAPARRAADGGDHALTAGAAAATDTPGQGSTPPDLRDLLYARYRAHYEAECEQAPNGCCGGLDTTVQGLFESHCAQQNATWRKRLACIVAEFGGSLIDGRLPDKEAALQTLRRLVRGIALEIVVSRTAVSPRAQFAAQVAHWLSTPERFGDVTGRLRSLLRRILRSKCADNDLSDLANALTGGPDEFKRALGARNSACRSALGRSMAGSEMEAEICLPRDGNTCRAIRLKRDSSWVSAGALETVRILEAIADRLADVCRETRSALQSAGCSVPDEAAAAASSAATESPGPAGEPEDPCTKLFGDERKWLGGVQCENRAGCLNKLTDARVIVRIPKPVPGAQGRSDWLAAADLAPNAAADAVAQQNRLAKVLTNLDALGAPDDRAEGIAACEEAEDLLSSFGLAGVVPGFDSQQCDHGIPQELENALRQLVERLDQVARLAWVVAAADWSAPQTAVNIEAVIQTMNAVCNEADTVGISSGGLCKIWRKVATVLRDGDLRALVVNASRGDPRAVVQALLQLALNAAREGTAAPTKPDPLRKAYADFIVKLASYALEFDNPGESGNLARQALRSAAVSLLLNLGYSGVPSKHQTQYDLTLERDSPAQSRARGFFTPCVGVRGEWSDSFRNQATPEGFRTFPAVDWLIPVRYAFTDYIGFQVSLVDVLGPLQEVSLRQQGGHIRNEARVLWDFVRPRFDFWLALPQLTRHVALTLGLGYRVAFLEAKVAQGQNGAEASTELGYEYAGWRGISAGAGLLYVF